MELHQWKHGLPLKDCHLDLHDLDYPPQQKDNQKQQRHHSIMKQERQSELEERGGQPELQERGDRLDLQERGDRLDLQERGGLPELLHDHGCLSRLEPREIGGRPESQGLGGRLEPQKLGSQPEQWELVGRPKLQELNAQPEPRQHGGWLEPPELQDHEGWAEIHRQGRKKQPLLREQLRQPHRCEQKLGQEDQQQQQQQQQQGQQLLVEDKQWLLQKPEEGPKHLVRQSKHHQQALNQHKNQQQTSSQQKHQHCMPQQGLYRKNQEHQQGLQLKDNDLQLQQMEQRSKEGLLEHKPKQELCQQQQHSHGNNQPDQEQRHAPPPLQQRKQQHVSRPQEQQQRHGPTPPQEHELRHEPPPHDDDQKQWLELRALKHYPHQAEQGLHQQEQQQHNQQQVSHKVQLQNVQEVWQQGRQRLVQQNAQHQKLLLQKPRQQVVRKQSEPFGVRCEGLRMSWLQQQRQPLPETRDSQEREQLSMRLDVQERGHLQTKQGLQHLEEHEAKELQPPRQKFRGGHQGDRRLRTFRKVLVEIGMDLYKKFFPTGARRPFESAQAPNTKRILPAPKTTGPSALARLGERFFCPLCGKGGFNQELLQQHLSMEHSPIRNTAEPRVVRGLPPTPPLKMEPPHFLPPGFVVATNESARLSSPSQPPALLSKPVPGHSSFGSNQPRSPMRLPSNDQMLFPPRQQRSTFLNLSQLMTTAVSTTTSKTTTQPNLVMYNITRVGNVLNPLHTTNLPTTPAARQIPQQSRGFERGQALSASEQSSKKGRPSWKDHVNTFTTNEHFKHERPVAEMLHRKKRTQLGCDQSGFSPVVMVKRLKLKHTEVGVTVSEQEIEKILKADKYLQQPFRSKKLEPKVLFKDHEDLCAENEVHVDAVQRGMKVAQSLAQRRMRGVCFLCPKIVCGPRQDIREQLAKHLAFSHGVVQNYDEVHKQVRNSCIHCQNPLGYPLSQYSLDRHHERGPLFSVTESPEPSTSPATVADVGQLSAPRSSSMAIVSTELENTSEKPTTVVSGPAKGEKMSELQMK